VNKPLNIHIGDVQLSDEDFEENIVKEDKNSVFYFHSKHSRTYSV
jgi:hypothetical protein